MNTEERRERLLGWLEIVYNKVQEVIINQHVFWEIQRVIDENPKLKNSSGFLNHWMASNFIHSAAMAVRLQADQDRRSVSMYRILTELQKYPRLVTREYFLSLYGNKDWECEIANHDFDEIAGEGANSLNPEWIDRDLKKLTTMSEAIKKYTDKRIAHYDQARLKQPVPTFTDLEEALKALEELVLHYWLVTKAVTVTQLLPTFQFDWKEVFYFPWIDSPRLHDH